MAVGITTTRRWAEWMLVVAALSLIAPAAAGRVAAQKPAEPGTSKPGASKPDASKPTPSKPTPSKPDSGTRVNPRAAAVAAFDARLKDYLSLRAKLEQTVPPLKETDNPAQITAREKALGDAIRAARPHAKPGDLFGPDTTPLIVDIIRRDWRARSPRDRAALFAELTAPFEPKVNSPYPSTQPLATFPPTLLKKLHQLPDDLEYRFAGRHLILRDVKGNLILDVIRDVLPARKSARPS